MWYKTTPPTQSPCTLRSERGPVYKRPWQLANTLFSQRSQGGRTSLNFTLVSKFWNDPIASQRNPRAAKHQEEKKNP
jgi:hypothetical protein